MSCISSPPFFLVPQFANLRKVMQLFRERFLEVQWAGAEPAAAGASVSAGATGAGSASIGLLAASGTSLQMTESTTSALSGSRSTVLGR